VHRAWRDGFRAGILDERVVQFVTHEDWQSNGHEKWRRVHPPDWDAPEQPTADPSAGPARPLKGSRPELTKQSTRASLMVESSRALQQSQESSRAYTLLDEQLPAADSSRSPPPGVRFEA
jgi:hypothetical protein